MSNAQAATSFSINLDKWLEKGKAKAKLKFIDVCLETAERVIRRTPVDTGFCRAMWSVSINAVPLMKPMERPEDWASLTKATANTRALATIEPKLIGAQITDRVWIYNPVEYAPALENGHSAQAPAGMVKITVGEMRAKYP